MTIQYQEYHGIQLAQGAELRNAVVERLVVDPSPVEVGRSWFNTTEGLYKFSTVDGTGALVIRVFATAEDLTAAISAASAAVAAEQARAEGVEAGLRSDLNNEASRAQAAESGLSSDITAETSRATTAEAGLQTAIDNETARATAAEGVLTAAVSAEEVRAKAAEAALGVRIDNVLANVDPAAIDSISELLNAFQVADASLTTAISNLSSSAASALAQEVAAREAADLALQGNISAEEAARINAISGVQADLATEIANRTSAVAGVQSNLNDEIAARIAGDSALDARVTTVEGQVNGKIGDLTSLNTTDKSTLVAAVNEVLADVDSETAARIAAVSAEAAAREAGDAAIRNDFNGKRKTFTSGSAALEHTFAHNFNTNEIGITLWVQRDDGKFYNDQAATQQFDVNTLKVYFTSARNIKLVVEDFSAI